MRKAIVRGASWAAVAGLALAGCTTGRADPGGGDAARDDRVVRRSVEDVFLLSGELGAVRSTSIVTPRGRGPLQIRWMAEDGAEVAEGDRLDGKIAPGMTARCILDTYPDRVFEGKVEEVGSVASEGGRRWATTRPGFPARVSLASTDPLMRPGLSVRVEVVRGTWEDALVVPRGAVRFEEEGPVVRRDGTEDPVKVTLTACTPVGCVVEKGLEEGDRVTRF